MSQSPMLDWMARLLPRILPISQVVRHRYTDSISHYRAVAAQLEAQFKDLTLARAGFLHGIPFTTLREHFGEELSSEIQILEYKQKFRAFDATSPRLADELADPLTHSLWESAGVLLVVEQLHHLDPDNQINEWSRNFHLNEVLPTDHLPYEPTFLGSHLDMEELLLFVDNVVAPVAKHLGMWHERNVLENAALLYRDRRRFNALAQFAMVSSSPNGSCNAPVRLVREALEGMGVAPTRWEWHHIATLAQKLPSGFMPHSTWRDQLYSCGYVTVICKDDTRCYEALGRLHVALSYAAEGVQYFPTATPAGYRAIHTTVQAQKLPDGSDVPPGLIHVRILPSEVDTQRFAAAERRGVAFRRSIKDVATSSEIEVFAPNGKRHTLPVGATVLNFAQQIHDEMVVLVRGAQVNQQTVDPLYPLVSGDVILLDVGSTPRLLPEGWENQVPVNTRRHIERAFRRHYRQALLSSGRARIRERIARMGVEELADDELDAIVAEAISSAIDPKHPFYGNKLDWWLEQLGIAAAQLNGDILPQRLQIVEDDRLKLMERIIEITARRLPKTKRSNPNKLHFILIDSRDRERLITDVSLVFAEHGISMAELVAIRLGGNRGLIRVTLDPLHESRLRLLLASLRHVPGVVAVNQLGKTLRTEEAMFFPARRTTVNPRRLHSSPFIHGGEVRDDKNFYGMGAELKDLHRAFGEVVQSKKASSVFICGPKKVGKTSLALAFARKLVHGDRAACLVVHLEATKEEPWSMYAPRMAEEVLAAASEMNPRAIHQLRPDARNDLGVLLGELSQSLKVPLVIEIDEAVQLFQASMNAGEEERIFDFMREISRIREILIVWIGPSAAARHLSRDLRELLQDGHRLPVSGLTYEDLRAMLRAEKLRSQMLINIDEQLVKRFYRETSGNPYWAAAIADAMWRRIQRKGQVLLQFNEADFKNALGRIQTDPVIFGDRYDAWTPGENRLARRTLVVLAMAARHSRKKKVGLTTKEICARLCSPDEQIEGATLESLLAVLDDAGTVCKDSGGGACTWTIAAPVLANHILFMQQQWGGG